ncbi:ATP-binding protein [Paraflavitalea pollutisoli]|uniref:ATP-binding protein n=1 Tax=Paraflavitalea pollutisoli TaxID=3034143 RepID=UPI0023EB8043|nr:ATP-binding protein [Paraflavitalea sp. H1-2-19X]
MEQFDLTPSPALLDLLGKIPFKGWQCVAELVDNSIDAVINHSSKLKDYQKVISVYIPTKGRIIENQPLIVEDWGIGMTEEQLENAVRAGFSSKNTNSNLGLFGMGFNVATSRLANTVQVWTATEEMEREIGVCIDLREMKKTGSFHRPKIEREKRADKISGTRIEIYDYKPEATNLLQSKQISRELNKAYAEKIFNEYGIKVLINKEEVKPFKFCVWDKKRSVKHKYDDVPSYIEIDQHLCDEMFCENCFSWLGETVDTTLNIECPHCHTIGKVVKKEIYILGWVGIQRYSDLEHYGIDISRNGRILSKLDKSFFYWEDERGKNDPQGRFSPEYPRDTTYAGGRIVGQLDANFVIPKYTKDDFEREDRVWKKVVDFIRGEMPLQPELASSFGFKQPNRSPIGRLFNAYRKMNVAGSKTLVFSKEDGSCDHVTPRNWANKFYEGDVDYQDDTKWWEAVTKADLKDTQSTFNPLNPTGKATSTKSGTSRPAPAPEKYQGKKLFKKALRYDIEKLIGEKPIDLTLIDYYPENDLSIPIIFESQGAMWKFNVYLNNSHPMFRDFADGYEDLIFMEVASKYAQAKNNFDEWTVTRIYYELKSRYALETMLNVPNLVAKASKLLRDIQNKLVSGEGILLPRKPNLHSADEAAIKKKYLDLERKSISDFNAFVMNTKYMKYLDLNYIFRFVEEFPDVIYDGKIFNLPYVELDDESKQHQSKKYTGYFSDVRWFMNDLSKEGDEAVKKQKQQIIRNRYSIEILDGSINR